jgi:excinuclease ABC subunit C
MEGKEDLGFRDNVHPVGTISFASIAPDFDLPAELARLPKQPGIYRMFDRDGDLIYVGKAKNLRNRVRSYFQNRPSGHTPKVRAMVANIARFNYIVTDTEVEALLLEDNLIKQNKPRYNILLRDDKRYPWIGLSGDIYPRLFVTRQPNRGSKAKYFGPYTSSSDMHALLQTIRKHFPLRQRPNPLFKDRPCINYHIGLCPGPCQKLISPEGYRKTVRQIELFLKGKTDELLKLIEREMLEASERMDFEAAAKLRDRYRAVENVNQHQKVVSSDERSQDVIATACQGLRCTVVVMSIRYGKLISSRAHSLSLAEGMEAAETEAELYSAFLTRHYREIAPDDLPEEVLVQYLPADAELLSEWLSERRGKKVRILQPEAGEKRELLNLGIKNAQVSLEQALLYDAQQDARDPIRALMELQEILDLPEFPERMECYDISHFQGSQTVASMVVFTGGRPDKAEYRRFKIQCAEGKPDDFASMAEVMRRRVDHLEDWGEPSLIIIDGGKGQLNAAVESLQKSGVTGIPIISLAKRYEEIYRPGEPLPVILSHDAVALQLLQQIRDEAHRFAITYHRTLRDQKATRSILDDIPGIGPARKQKLLQHFKTVEAIQQASPQAIAQAIGVSLTVGKQISQSLHAGDVESGEPSQAVTPRS